MGVITALTGYGYDRYFAGVLWIDGSTLVIVTTPRSQTEAAILALRVGEGSNVATVISRETSAAWVDPSSLRQRAFLATSPVGNEDQAWWMARIGFNNDHSDIQLFRISLEGGTLSGAEAGWIATAMPEAIALLGLRAVAGDKLQCFFTTTNGNPRNIGLGESTVTLNGASISSVELASVFTWEGFGSFSLAPDFSSVMVTKGGPGIPRKDLVQLQSTQSDHVKSPKLRRPEDEPASYPLATNEGVEQYISGITVPVMESMTLPAADGTQLNAYMMKPHNFSPSKKYPVLMYVYGGPGSQTVDSSWPWAGTRARWHGLLASMGVLVVSVDGRGTGNR